ncbi:Zinc finger, CCHC-type [Corchorus capsularis]|uniref:Zinc finger, CCHC-type n=1 Tax=Corchorus capsularis TaxID=210143 RepID=A0A1R3I9Z5_COCAP|nr:Zinc finger, CCHC-type [Corchorus capsularis]
MRRIVIHGLRPEYHGIVTATRSWEKEPTLTDLENILVNQETLDKQKSKVSIKNDENALFVKKGVAKEGESSRSRQGWRRGQRGRHPQRGGAQPVRDKDDNEEKRHRRLNDKCYNCGKVGHFARDYWFKQAQGNAATTSRGGNDSEEDWDFQVSFAVEEPEELATACTVEPEQETALSMVSKIDFSNDWLVDSYCSNHMTGDKEKLSNMSTYAGKRMVVTANNSKLPITHIGQTVIVPKLGQHQVQIGNVFHVSGMKKNLLSVAQLTDPGNYVVFGPKDVKVYPSFTPTSPPIMEGKRMEFVYVMSA